MVLSIIAVSYTHLDVYKRQDIMRGLSVALSAEHVYDSIYSVGLILLYFKVEFHHSTFLTVSGE